MKFIADVSIQVNRGEIVNSSWPKWWRSIYLFYMIVGLVSPNKGQVLLDNKDISNMPMYKRAQLGIGYLPQEVSVFRKLSVEDNILGILEMTKLKKKEELLNLNFIRRV